MAEDYDSCRRLIALAIVSGATFFGMLSLVPWNKVTRLMDVDRDAWERELENAYGVRRGQAIYARILRPLVRCLDALFVAWFSGLLLPSLLWGLWQVTSGRSEEAAGPLVLAVCGFFGLVWIIRLEKRGLVGAKYDLTYRVIRLFLLPPGNPDVERDDLRID